MSSRAEALQFFMAGGIRFTITDFDGSIVDEAVPYYYQETPWLRSPHYEIIFKVEISPNGQMLTLTQGTRPGNWQLIGIELA